MGQGRTLLEYDLSFIEREFIPVLTDELQFFIREKGEYVVSLLAILAIPEIILSSHTINIRAV
jgi:hypothetical protein